MKWKWIIAAFILGICAGSSNGEDKKTVEEISKEFANLKAEMANQKAEQELELNKHRVELDRQRIENAKLKFLMDEQKMKMEEVQAKSSQKKMAKRQDDDTVVIRLDSWQEDMKAKTRKICVEEIRRYHQKHQHNETANLKKLIDEEIRKLMPSDKLVEIVYNGTAGASATKDDHAAKYAFQNTAKYWGGRHNNKGPSIVWFHFRTAHRLAKIGFQGGRNNYAPKSFEVVGSNDCSTWTKMFSTSNLRIPKDDSSTFFSWNIEKRHRLSFSCIGIKSITENSERPTNYPEIKNIIMWEEI